MPDLKITELTAYTSASITDVIPIVDITTSTTKKITLNDIIITPFVTDRHLSMRPYILTSRVVKVVNDFELVPTQIDFGATSGFSMPLYSAGNQEELYFNEYIAGRWNGVSDINCIVIGYLSASATINNDFKFQLSWTSKSTASGSIPSVTTDVTVDTNIDSGRQGQYSIYKIEFAIDYNANTPNITASDFWSGRLRRIATTGTEYAGEFVITGIILTYVVDKIFKI